jgi:hypothetical protein
LQRERIIRDFGAAPGDFTRVTALSFDLARPVKSAHFMLKKYRREKATNFRHRLPTDEHRLKRFTSIAHPACHGDIGFTCICTHICGVDMKTNNVTAQFAKITIPHVMLRIVKRYCMET